MNTHDGSRLNARTVATPHSVQKNSRSYETPAAALATHDRCSVLTMQKRWGSRELLERLLEATFLLL
jgi:hypothetical protein